jgi:peroxiredoxin family protein
MKHLAIVVRDDAYDRLLTPLTFAWVMANEGTEVDILFVLWAVRVLTPAGVTALEVDAHHAPEEAWLRERLARDGAPVEIRDFLRLLKRTGKVRLYACRLAAATFDVVAEGLIDEADGMVDSSWFLKEKAVTADHCQYF